ncbi:L,D-transpeptidase [Streptomyces sp. SID5643]|uniref:L,D-transpeptidase family protein n=1 Tax=Streptomyces sp. SID5643 TaxID=2690307 RepID=UPI0031FEB06B
MIRRRTAGRALALPLAVAAVLPVGAAGAASVPPAPGPSAGPVPGVAPGPARPWSLDTPDQALPPVVYTPSAEEEAVEPRSAVAGTYALVEYVPLGEAVARVSCTAQAGPYQRQVERWLGRRVDGVHSAGDCRAVRAFQVQQGIRPARGFAGPVTWSRMQYLSARRDPNAAGNCPVRSHPVACVGLGRRLMSVQKGRQIVFGRCPPRSGRVGYRARAGWHKVYWRHKNHWSTLYNTPMPYSQFFSGGQAFHGVHGSLHTAVGSLGCVHLTVGDARRLRGVLKKGDRVFVWGRRPGT